jgi:hypothetical protein
LVRGIAAHGRTGQAGRLVVWALFKANPSVLSGSFRFPKLFVLFVGDIQAQHDVRQRYQRLYQ